MALFPLKGVRKHYDGQMIKKFRALYGTCSSKTVIFEVRRAVEIKITGFLNVMPCSLADSTNNPLASCLGYKTLKMVAAVSSETLARKTG
jgi:hypothetical protein